MRRIPTGIGHVVEHLDGQDEVVVARDRRVGGVAHLEPGPVGDPGVVAALLGDRDGRVVEVVAVDLRVRVRPGDRDRRQALAAADLGDAHRLPGVSFACTSGNAGSQFWVRWFTNTGRVKAAWTSCRSNRPNAAPVPLRNSSTMMSIALPSHGTTAAHGFMHASLSSSRSTCAWALGSVKRRSCGGLGGVVDLDHAGDGLLLEPLPRVAVGDAGRARELAGGHRSRAGQRLVEPEPDTQLDVGELHRGQARHEQVPGELLDLGLVVAGQLDRRHGPPSATALTRDTMRKASTTAHDPAFVDPDMAHQAPRSDRHSSVTTGP